MDEYRQHLTETYEQLSIGYARTLITLAGGALGLSMAFVREIVGPPSEVYRHLLMYAWSLWATSLSLVLVGYYCGSQAAAHAIDQFDNDLLETQRPGGYWAYAVDWLGRLSLLAFVGGIGFFLNYIRHAWEAP